jgi:hypothetical protein
MSGLDVVKAYLASHPRLTAAVVAFNLVGAAVMMWRFGPLAVVWAAAIYAQLTLALKFMLLLWFHPKLFSFRRQIGPVLLSILLLLGAAAALQFPLYGQMCAMDPAALGQSHVCAEFAP